MRPVYPEHEMPCALCNTQPVGPKSRWVCESCGDTIVSEVVERMTSDGLFFIAHVVLEEHGFLDENLEITHRGNLWLTNIDDWDITDPVELLALMPLATEAREAVYGGMLGAEPNVMDALDGLLRHDAHERRN